MKIVIHREKNQKLFLQFSLILTFISETLLTMEVLPDISIVKSIQYVITLFPMFLCGMHLYINREFRRREIYFGEELKTGIVVVVVFACLSIRQSIYAGAFAETFAMQLFQLLLPFIYAFLVINELTLDEIMTFMKIVLFLTVLGYLYQIDFSQITFQNIFAISLMRSYSPFENSSYAEVANGLAAYFIYNRKKAPGAFWISLLLNFLIFKRVLFLMAVILLFVEWFRWADKELSSKWIKRSGIFWLVFISGYYYLAQPEIAATIYRNTRFNINEFSMSRIYRLWYLMENNFVSYGLGSTQEYLARYSRSWGEMEMDFVRIFFEIGPIAIFVFVWGYLKICRRNCYAYVLISMCFLNLLVSNGLLQYRGYIFRFVTIAVINYNSQRMISKRMVEQEGKF